jgi:hypothetical protein
MKSITSQLEQYTALWDVIADGSKGVGRRFASVFHLSLFTIHCSQRVASLLEVGNIVLLNNTIVWYRHTVWMS